MMKILWSIKHLAEKMHCKENKKPIKWDASGGSKAKRFIPDVIFLIKDKFLIFVGRLLLVFTVF